MLLVNVLGPLTITVGGAPLGRMPRKARAILAYLAMIGVPVARERLADLLWPLQPTDQARHSLRNCLLELRRTPARAHLVCDFFTCSVVEVKTDVQAFRRLVAEGDYGKAGRLVRGELLQDFNIACEPWNEWLDGEREGVRELLGRSLSKFSETLAAAGLYDEAIEAARRWVSLDNMHEPAHQRLMQVLAAAGQRSAALHQYKRLEKIMRDELGVAPDRESRLLADQIVHEDRVPDDRETEIDPIPARWRQLGQAALNWLAGTGKLTKSQVEELGTTVIAAAEGREQQRATIDGLRATIAELRETLAATRAMMVLDDEPEEPIREYSVAA
jgi:DNA-binding SARP family transcriptional activator